MPPFQAQPRIIFESPTGKAEPFRDVRRQSRAPRFIRDDIRQKTWLCGSGASAARLAYLSRFIRLHKMKRARLHKMKKGRLKSSPIRIVGSAGSPDSSGEPTILTNRD